MENQHLIAATSQHPLTFPPADAAPLPVDREAAAVLVTARRAQQAWAAIPLAARLKALRTLRRLIGQHAMTLAESVQKPGRTLRETLVAEVLPVCQAIQFLERNAGRILRPIKSSSGYWPLTGSTRVDLLREPAGVVLIIGPGNYPLFLPAVQLVQALCAGNAVLFKPAPGAGACVGLLRDLALQAGIPSALITLLDETDLAIIPDFLRLGVDHVLLTGSATTGAAMLDQIVITAQATGAVIPATLELSGCDAVFIQKDADLPLAARCIAFALCFNAGATCIGPRRVFISAQHHDVLLTHLLVALKEASPVPLSKQVARWVRNAVADGAKIHGDVNANPDSLVGPVVLTHVTPDMAIACNDLMAPIVSILTAATDDEALQLNSQCPYALGAAVFGSVASATHLARQIDAGVVTINDLVVPHADPRVPLAPRGRSGIGASRGAQGLLELTRIKAITRRTPGGARFYLRPPASGDAELFAAWIHLTHGARSLPNRISALRRLFRAARTRGHALR